jgi:hypothetical protein
MDEQEVHNIRLQLNDGKLVSVLAREKGRRSEEGVEGVVLSLLDPRSLREVIEYWVPIAEFEKERQTGR